MRDRGEPPETFADIDAQEAAYRAEGYDMSRGEVMPDTYCLAWRQSALARRFACQWSLEVVLFSMREQLSFDHARPEGLNVNWLPWRLGS